MGVVYKLKKEVIDCIVDQKRHNPRLSCRSLVDVVKERFKLEVSKSSVNAILKEAQLSSPIGRRPYSDKKAAKFKLPDFRKKQLFEERQVLLPEKREPEEKEARKTEEKAFQKEETMSKQKRPQKQQALSPSLDKKRDQENKRPQKGDNVVSLDLGTQERESFPEKKAMGQGKQLGLGPLYDGMGCFLLKAAEWELSSAPLLGKMVAPYAKGYLLKDVNPVAEVLLFAKAFGLSRWEDFESYKGEGLWTLNNIKGKIESEFIQKLMLSVDDPGKLSLGISAEFLQIFAQAGCFRVQLEDNTQFYVDARFKSVTAEAFFGAEQVAVNKCLSEISESLIANTRPLILERIPGEEAFARSFFDMLGAFEKADGMGICEVALLDSHGQEMASFTTIPNKKRNFIAGSSLSQKECRMLVEKSPELIKICYLPSLGKEILFSELRARLTVKEKSCAMRVALIREKGSREPTDVIMTNIGESEMTIENVLSLYFMRWPNVRQDAVALKEDLLMESFPPLSEDAIPRLEGEGYYRLLQEGEDFWVNAHFLLAAMHEYCKRHFLPRHCQSLAFLPIKEKFYSLPGHVVVQEGIVKVYLVASGEPGDVEYAIRRFNENNPFDFAGRRVLAFFVKR